MSIRVEVVVVPLAVVRKRMLVPWAVGVQFSLAINWMLARAVVAKSVPS